MFQEKVLFADTQEHGNEGKGYLDMSKFVCHLASLGVYKFHGLGPVGVVDFSDCDL